MAEAVVLGDGVGVAVGRTQPNGVDVWVLVDVAEAVQVGDGPGVLVIVDVDEAVQVGEGVRLRTGVAEEVRVGDRTAVFVGVGEAVEEGEGTEVAVRDGVTLWVARVEGVVDRVAVGVVDVVRVGERV